MNSPVPFDPPDVIEIWRPGSNRPFMRLHSSVRIQRGDKISIQGSTYKVIYASYAIDYSERVFERQMRLNLTVEPEVDSKQKTRAGRNKPVPVTGDKTGP